MAKANGTMVYPLTSQVNDADANEAYATMTTEFSSGKAFKDVSVNPKLKATYVEAEQNGTGSATSDVVASAIFTEIRKGPHGASISNDKADQIGNRILPVDTTLTAYATNKELTASYKMKVYDTSISAGNTNRKLVYADTSLGATVIDHPATDIVALDIENYDYFIMINPEIFDSTTQTDSARPHFAKITQIATFSEFGDGVEFTPKYPSPIPKGTNFEIFKGPAKTATDVMAVSYGLRGDNQASTDNYDVLNLVATPTFYFYNDRLEQDDQLDYMEKYTLTRLRWYDYSASVTMTSNTEIALYSEGSSTVKFTTNGTSETDKLCAGMSLFDSATDEWYGNIKQIVNLSNDIYLEVAYKAKTATTNNFTVKIGKGIQNIVFRTEARLKGTIPNIGKSKLDATLVDNLRTTDDGDGSFDPMFWQKAFPNMKRHETDSTTASASTLDGNMNGPSRYITTDPRPRRNDIIPLTTDVIVNSPQNKMSKICKVITMNNSGMMPHKIRQSQTLKVMKTVFSDKSTFKKLPFKASKVDGANEIRFIEMDDAHDYNLSDKLPTNSILRIDGYYYVVNEQQAVSSGTQDITVKANKTLKANTFTVAATVHEFQNEDVEIASWTGVLNTENFDSDTQVEYADGDRLTVSGTTVKKEDSKFYDTKVVFSNLSGHQNSVDLIDKDMEYVKFQDASRKFYQNSSIQRFYYYEDTYSLQEEVFSGIVELTETSAEKGLSMMVIEGRDKNASLLNTLVDKNLAFSEDMVYSGLNPIAPSSALTSTSMRVADVTSHTITMHSDSQTFNPKRKTLLFTRSTTEADNMKFIGEVASTGTAPVSGARTVTLSHRPLTNILAGNTWNSIYTYDPLLAVTYLSGVKALGSNPALTNTTTDFSRVSDKGVVFSDSYQISRINNSPTHTLTKLESTSNTGSFGENRTLGYDITDPISIKSLDSSVATQDSTFAFQLSNETGVSTDKINKMTFASEMFDVVETISKDDGGFRMSIAPVCPIVMGRIESNTSDTRASHSLYLVNNNINSGGFIHRIDAQDGSTGNLDYTSADNMYTPRETYRYWDLQKLSYGSLTKSDAGIYLNSKSPQAIGGYAIAYPIKGNGIAPSTSTLSPSTAPILGSNMLDDNYTLRHTAGSPFATVSPTSLPHETVLRYGSNNSTASEIGNLLNHSPSAQNYELFATGDLFPYSKLRYNNIGYETLNFETLSCLLESEGAASTTSISHSSYSGKTNSAEKRDTNYERASIKSASKTTNQMKRFGVVRLVEATYDWHFNPIDPDDLPSPSDSVIELAKYQMVKPPESVSNLNLNVVIDSGNHKITFTGGGTVSLSSGDVLFRKDTGQAVFVVSADVNLATNTTSANLKNVTGSTDALNTPAYLIKEYGKLSFDVRKFTGDSFSNPILNGQDNATKKFDFTSVYLVRPNHCADDGNFKYARLQRSDAGTGGADANNVYLPLVFNATKSSDATIGTLDISDESPYHPPETWHTLTGGDAYVNTSRVIAGLLKNTTANSSNGFITTSITTSQKYGLAESANIYDNCVGVFRNVRKASHGGPDVPEDLYQTSARLGIEDDSISSHSSMLHSSVGTANGSHTDNTRVFQIPPTGSSGVVSYAISGTSTRSSQVSQADGTSIINDINFFLSDGEHTPIGFTRKYSHSSLDHTTETDGIPDSQDKGGLYRAQMMIKPILDISRSDVSLNTERDVITITTSGATKHAWVTFVPKLTGHYLVSEKEQEEGADVNLGSVGVNIVDRDHHEITMQSSGGNIGHLSKIIKHTTDQTSVSQGTVTHVLYLDRPLPAVEQVGSQYHSLRPLYRLMRISEKTFRNTPNEIILNRMHSTGLDYSETSSCFTSGEIDGRSPSGFNHMNLNEGVFAAYVLMNLDVAPPSPSNQSLIPEFASLSSANLPYSDGDVFDCFITDGINKQRKQVTVSIKAKSKTNGIRRDERKLTFEGEITGNGVVSFGEIIDLELRKKPDLANITKCHIGTSIIIGEEVETEMENLAKEAGLGVNMIQTQADFTGNIVQSVSNNVITCKAEIENVVAGDVIYTHEGYPIGVVGSVSGSTITVTDIHTDADVDLWFVPLLNDEIVKRNKKTFISTNNFTQTSAFNALNKLAAKKNLDFNIKDKKVVFRDLDNAPLLRKQRISYLTNKVFSVKKNSSLFAKANKVTVIGDKIRTSVSNDDDGTHISFVDPTIRNITDAKVKANELLELHSSDARKITLNLEKTGLETLEAGDIVFLDFPQYDIPPDDYIIFEIENVLTPTLTMTVGTFDKTIAERLAELGTQQRSSSSTLFNRNAEQVSSGKLLTDSIPLKTTLVQYTITGTGETANMGFDDLFGFGETVGFETTANQVIGYYTSED